MYYDILSKIFCTTVLQLHFQFIQSDLFPVPCLNLQNLKFRSRRVLTGPLAKKEEAAKVVRNFIADAKTQQQHARRDPQRPRRVRE